MQLTGDSPVAPVRVLAREAEDQLSHRPVERRSARLAVRIRPVTGDELTVPAQQRLRLHREARPRLPGQHATQRRQQRTIRSVQLRFLGLPAQNRQLMPQNQDLELLRAARTPEKPYEREQVPHD